MTSAREFELTVEKFFDSSLDDASVGELLFGLDEDEDEDESAAGRLKDDVTAAADNELVKLVNKIMPKKPEAPKKPARVCPYCKSEIADDATRCPHCTSQL